MWKMDAVRRLAVIVVLSLGCLSGAAAASAETKPLVVFLVRHAEKVDASRDPELSSQGKRRAEQLAKVLRDAQIEFIHSSPYKRTRNTAQPIAHRLDLKVALYDPRNLSALVEKLKSVGGRHLVVGHSNTTPAAAKLLGGEPGEPIHEPSEYDRLYCLTINASGKTTTLLLRYGDPPPQVETGGAGR